MLGEYQTRTPHKARLSFEWKGIFQIDKDQECLSVQSLLKELAMDTFNKEALVFL